MMDLVQLGGRYQGVLDALDPHIVVLDRSGTIIETNTAWDRFASQNGGVIARSSVGINYLEASCRPDESDRYARAAQAGIAEVLDGRRSTFSLKYPCNSLDTERWFLLTARSLRRSDGGGAIVIHTNVTATHDMEERYRLLAEQGSDVLEVIGDDGRLSYVSPSVERVLGYADRDYVARFTIPGFPLVHPDDQERHDAAYAAARAGEERCVECRYRTKERGDRWVEVMFKSLTNDVGERVGIHARIRDIHNERIAREQLRESEGRFNAFMNNSPFTAYMKDEDGRYKYVNSQFERQFGVDKSWLTGKTVREWMGDDVADRVDGNDRIVLETDRPAEFIDTISGKDGDPRTWFSLRFPFTDVAGRRFVGGISLDVTERQRQDAERMRLASIVETSQDPIYSTTPEGRFISWNPAAEQLYGYRAEEVLGQPMEILVPPEERESLLRLRSQVVRGERIALYETRRVTRDGQVIDVALTLSSIRDSDNRIIGASTITRDITERKRMIEERHRLYSELRDEVNRAAEIQAHLLPRVVPNLPGFVFAAVCLPAREVGGDFFDWSDNGDGVRVSLGDVTGKGMSAALLMATSRASLRSTAEVSVDRALTTVNRVLSHDLEQSDAFVTLFLADLARDGTLTYTDAGHGMAMILRDGGGVEPLQQRSLPIGILSETRYAPSRTVLMPGETLVIYSDGLPDARPDLRLNEPADIAAQCGGVRDAHQLLDRLVTMASAGGPRPDDLTLVCVHRRGNPT